MFTLNRSPLRTINNVWRRAVANQNEPTRNPQQGGQAQQGQGQQNQPGQQPGQNPNQNPDQQQQQQNPNPNDQGRQKEQPTPKQA